jgi:hypothetical protein
MRPDDYSHYVAICLDDEGRAVLKSSKNMKEHRTHILDPEARGRFNHYVKAFLQDGKCDLCGDRQQSADVTRSGHSEASKTTQAVQHTVDRDSTTRRTRKVISSQVCQAPASA